MRDPGLTIPRKHQSRWGCERAHQQLKEELGVDHVEGRSWGGLHRHALMSMMAYAFLQSWRLDQTKGGERTPIHRRSSARGSEA